MTLNGLRDPHQSTLQLGRVSSRSTELARFAQTSPCVEPLSRPCEYVAVSAPLVPHPTPVFPLLARMASRRDVPRQIAVLSEQRRFPMQIDFSRADVRLPFGVPRFVNAATLRAMASAPSFTQVLKKVGPAWKFIDDNTMIDLFDRSQKFRLGRLTILS